jgi:3-dehydroquinate dehydratase-2
MALIAIINGPNLNMVGKRQPDIYGKVGFDEFIPKLKNRYPQHDIVYLQSNHEGRLIDWIQEYGFKAEGIILNAGGYTHTSVALADAVAAVLCRVVEVHISNILEREPFRHHSYLSPVCAHTIMGLGLDGYTNAVEWLFPGP